jgi:hypothetical protein
MTTLETIRPYVEQLFDDDDVHKQLARATANLRGAKSRAGRAKSAKRALKDPTLRHRLLEGGRATVAAAVAIRRGPPKQRRRHRGRRLLILAGLGAGVFVATNPGARSRLLGLIGTSVERPRT